MRLPVATVVGASPSYPAAWPRRGDGAGSNCGPRERRCRAGRLPGGSARGRNWLR